MLESGDEPQPAAQELSSAAAAPTQQLDSVQEAAQQDGISLAHSGNALALPASDQVSYSALYCQRDVGTTCVAVGSTFDASSSVRITCDAVSGSKQATYQQVIGTLQLLWAATCHCSAKDGSGNA